MSADELIKLEAAMQQNMVLVGFKIHERQRQMKDEVNSLTNAQAVLGYVLAGRKIVKECIMSCFTTPAILEMPGHYLWRVHESFEFYLSDDNSDVISVPAGFVTDLATVPCIFWSVMPPDGKYAKAAIIHDYLYDNALRTKKEANLIFLDGMTVPGAPKWKRIEMYLAVR
ncbi:Uncharacterized protein y4iH Flags: Precursor [Salmonella enterica]|nr:Uncharacterized protein y4iH Flags: Precursor [Salmonella enterica]